MSDEMRFEALLAQRLAAYAADADRPFDPAAIARTAIAGTARRGLLGRLLPVPVLADRRLLTIAAAFLMLAALLVALAVIGSQLSDARRLVSLSQAVHQNPPPFTMTTTVYDIPGDSGTFHACMSDWGGLPENVGQMRLHYFYDGQGRFRQACEPGDAEGFGLAEVAYIVLGPDGQGGAWTGTEWIEGPHPGIRSPSAPLATVDWLNWINEGSFLKGEDEPVDCADWQLGSTATVAGRSAREVFCGTDRFWIDDASHLLVKREQDGVLISEALELEVGVVPPAELFVLAPANVRWPLRVGEAPPGWTLPLARGGTLSWTSLLGQPTAVLIEAGPSTLLGLDAFAAAVAARLDRMNALAMTDRASASDVAGFPVVVDDGTTLPSWHLDVGIWLFDANGRIEARLYARSSASLGAALDAWLAGDEIPLGPAGDGVIVAGQPVPALVAPLVGGGTFDLADSLGKPVLILNPGSRNFFSGGFEPLGLAPIAEFASASRLVGDGAAAFVLAWETEYWTRGAGRSAMLDSGLPFVMAAGTPWSALQGPNVAPDGKGLFRAAIVVLDADGIVRRVISDDLPTATELADLVSQLAEGGT